MEIFIIPVVTGWVVYWKCIIHIKHYSLSAGDIKRREREIQKERDYREHELRMEYEKRLEEFEADYRLKE